MSQINRFNLRVYALIQNDRGQYLVSYEGMGRHSFTKFPGGGLELGEGLIEGLKREVKEECSQELVGVTHFYTTDFFQQSAFKESDQLISFYFTATFMEPCENTERLLPSKVEEGKSQRFVWQNLEEIELTFPIDKHVLGLLKKR